MLRVNPIHKQPMSKVVFDNIIYSLQRFGGISSLWHQIIGHVSSLPQFDVHGLDYKAANQNVEYCQLPQITHRQWPTTVERYLDADYRIDGPHTFHSSYYRLSTHPQARCVTTVHDFTYESHIHGLRCAVHSAQKFRAIRRSAVVVCVSQFTRNELLRRLPDVPASKVEVVYNGLNPAYNQHFEPLPELADCILFVGSRASYKRFDFAVEACADAGLRLCIAGSPLTKSERQLLERRLPGRYLVEISPNSARLGQLYTSARCLLYPSESEGFGLPIIEAQACGCPVIALAATSVPEVIGHTPTLMKALTINDFRAGMAPVVTAATRAEIIAAGRANAARFPIAATTAAYTDILS